VHVLIHQVAAAEVDEMWSVVGHTTQQRWLWHASDHRTGVMLADVVGSRQDEVLVQWNQLLAPCGLHHFYTDGAEVYQRHVEPEQPTVGKTSTQKLERTHLTWRTRMKRFVRKTIGFSKSILLHDMVIGLLVNRSEFGMVI
jgi:insertion element IS1 protein InsB